ncbi:ATP-dependent RNA helicase RhlB [Spartinivicinus poritis]|uniref:ATP-dependent RNA helicase RhlB n=1 Tax=Spartinivicinus poritis TaxID=2994640 RepID=A0ABT5UC80_9GAMM|nr:ATP-dependent RNA helicase RhlB [Spartinivicinus sp. A2-2]MDE1463988.1 ATP-dependent RNA helicase RhlB [Spartinivicinus sp. A2-2]
MIKIFNKIFKPKHHTTTTSPSSPESQELSDKPSKTVNQKSSSSPNKASWNISEFAVPEAEGKTRFHDFELPDILMQAIHNLGFSYCTPIQAEVLTATLAGRDAIGRAQTGTGKTAAFLISTIKQLLETPSPTPRYAGEPRALILAPTRELAIQIANDAKELCKFSSINVTTIMGGMEYDKQRRHLHNEFLDIVVATPGRLIDYYEKQDIHLDLLEVLVIDEADRMLDMGFIPQVRRIVRATPKRGDRQTLLFSATFNDEVTRLIDQWTYQPVKVEIEPEQVTTDTVVQHFYMVEENSKAKLLVNLILQEDLHRIIVFANRRDQTRKLQELLYQVGISCDLLSGEVAQKKRLRTLEDFREGRIRVLVATDVAGRGIHVDGISHVINYNLPDDLEDYVHRIGRTGRAGATGVAISLTGESDAFLLPELEQLLGMSLTIEQPPESYLTQRLPVKGKTSPAKNHHRKPHKQYKKTGHHKKPQRRR